MSPVARHGATRNRWRSVRLAWLLLWPLVGYAEPFDASQLGLRIPDLPAGASKPRLVDELDGLALSFQIGAAHVHIVRLKDPVPAGTSVADADYRKRLIAYFGDALGPDPNEAATTIDGHSAWTTCSFWRSDTAHYTCIMSMLVEQHLYRLTVEAMGSEQRPPEFDAAVRVLSALKLEPIHPAVAAGGPPPAAPPLEPQQLPTSGESYPAEAGAHGPSEGAADVQFAIGGDGHARDARQLYATAPVFGAQAMSLVQAAPFRVPADWDAHGSQQQFVREYHFYPGDTQQACRDTAPAHVPGAEVVLVCGSGR